MQGIASAGVLILIMIELHQGVTASKPEIIVAPSWSVIAKDEFLIQEGDELKIVCQGEGRIQFSKQNLPPYFKQSDSTGSFDESTGTYTFIRPRTIAEDTGWYACADESIEIRNDLQTIDHPSDNISWIYVYVNSSWPFAGMDISYEAIAIPAGSDGVIPCRPTSPDLPVIFESSSGESPLPEDTKYHPKIGFILEAVGQELNRETVTCKLNRTYEEDPEWPSYYVLVEAVKQIETPTINEDTLRHVVRGENITLECTITVEPKKFNLRWIAPSSVPKERLIFPAKMIYVKSIGSMETWKNKLIVKNVEKSDGGEYICVAETITGHKSQSSMKLKIWDNERLSNTDIKTDKWLQIASGEDLTLRCSITVRKGATVVLYWKTPNSGAKNRSSLTSSFFKTGDKITSQINLTITNAVESDAGEYTCVAEDTIDTVSSSTSVTISDSSRGNLCKDPGTSLHELQRVLLVKQIQGAEALERAATSLEAVGKSLERSTNQLNGLLRKLISK